MPSANRTQVTSVVEVTLGTTPNTPRMRTRTINGESLRYTPQYVEPADLRADRMTGDSILVGTESSGGLSYEFNYPVPDSPEDIDIISAFYSLWTNTPTRYNDGTADSVITAVTASSDTYTVTTGAAFVVGHLVLPTGFTNAGNNVIFRAQSGSGATSVVAPASPGLTDESAPPGTAKLKVVGFQGASGDITATSTGLGSTALDFTTLGIPVGTWVKIGGTATADKFATAALNSWARVTAVAATALTLDNLPTGWTTDSGTSKTIKVWFGDHIANGTTQIGQTIERGFLGQSVPTYIVQKGMVAGQYQFNLEAKQKVTVAVTYMGMSGSQSTTTLDASPDAAPSLSSYPIFAASANVARVGEGGSALSSPNWARSMQVTISNNLTAIESITDQGPAGIVGHECTVTASLNTYFGDNSLLTKFFNGTSTSSASIMTKGSQAVILALPRLIYNGDGSPNATAKNTDVMLPLQARASKDETVTNALVTMSRLEYFE